MAMDGLPEEVSPSGRVPEQLLQAAPILKRRRRRRNTEGFAKKGSCSEGFRTRGKYRRRGESGGHPGQPGGPLVRPRVGRRQAPSCVPVGGPPAPSWFFRKVPLS